MNDELERILEENGLGIIEIISRYLSIGAEENLEILNEESRFPDQYSNRLSPKHESRALPLGQSVRFQVVYKCILKLFDNLLKSRVIGWLFVKLVKTNSVISAFPNLRKNFLSY
jgi:hypothetical protein